MPKSSVIQSITSQTNKLFLSIFADFDLAKISLVFLSDYPQRAETLVRGYSAHAAQSVAVTKKIKLYGGRINENPFPSGAEQVGYSGNFDNFTVENMTGIARLVSEEKIAISAYEVCPDLEWEAVFGKERVCKKQYESRLGILLLENKRWLAKILLHAQLRSNSIPHVMINLSNSTPSFEELAQKLNTSTFVIQGGLTTHGGTSGSDTSIVNNQREMDDCLLNRAGVIKAVRFVAGLQGNYSLFVGNNRPSSSGFGCDQGGLSKKFNPQEPMDEILTQLKETQKFSEKELIVIPGRATAKIVGEPSCTLFPLEGSVHDGGYVYPQVIREQLQVIASKLGLFAASLGYVGILGFDFLVDSENHVWVNEINARQQGPTTLIGTAGEHIAGVPDIMKLAYIFAFSTHFGKAEFYSFIQDLQNNAQKIGELYSTSPGYYYLKVQALHPANERRKIKHDLQLPGLYKLTTSQKNVPKQGSQVLQGYTIEAPKTKIGDELCVMLVGSSLSKGDELEGGKQLFRVVGCGATTADSPIGLDIKQHRFYLKDEYKDCISSLQFHLFDRDDGDNS